MTSAIEVSDLCYAYPALAAGGQPTPVLKGVTLRVESGEFVALMGKTGAGKTTLCLALNGIVPHSTGGVFGGQVRVHGVDTREVEVATLAFTVGLVFQDPESQFFTMSVEDEVAFGPEGQGLPPSAIAERVKWALGVVDMLPYRRRSPFQLSGGQMQRVAIAAMLAMRPGVLVLDEPTAGLDPVGKAEVFRAVRQLREQGITVILAEQDAEKVAEFADRVVILEDGRISLQGSPDAVFSQSATLARAGLAVPQVSELAEQLNRTWHTAFTFTRLDGACAALACDLEGRSASLASNPMGHADLTHDQRPALIPSHNRQAPARAQDGDAPCIRTEGLYFQYTDEIVALRGIDLEIPTGAFVAVLGQNGSGKTTLVKHFNGLLKPSRGEVWVNGESTARHSVGHLARSVGYVFQNPDHQIFCPSVREEIAFGPRNLGLPPDVVLQRTELALERFGLASHAQEPPALLGFGLRRKVSLAAVYAMSPRLLILDEPTTGLDWASALDLMALVQELHRGGHTILLVTHDMQLAATYAERVLVLQDGRLLLDGDTRWAFRQRDTLRQAQLEPPQIARLALCLRERGAAISEDVLTVNDFATAYSASRRFPNLRETCAEEPSL